MCVTPLIDPWLTKERATRTVELVRLFDTSLRVVLVFDLDKPEA
jgi:hypothetical protein